MAAPVTSAPVVVTGATGYIASHIVEQLLSSGYRVRGSVRDVDSARRGHLGSFDGGLELVAADLNDSGAFDEIVAGVEYVIHTASPYVITVRDPQRDLVDPALNGTRSVLEACAAASTVKRLVVTSSMAAMTDAFDGTTIDENTWNDRSSVTRNPYYYSKVAAERAAWAFIEEKAPQFDLVVINPFGVIGPEHGDRVNQTPRLLADMTTARSPFILDLAFGFVDVRDVARSHIAAIETPGASGRHVCAAEVRNFSEIAAFMAREFPELKRPKLRMTGPIGTRIMRVLALAQPSGVRHVLRDNLGKTLSFDNSKIRRELGIEFRPVDDSLRDTFNDLIARNKVKT